MWRLKFQCLAASPARLLAHPCVLFPDELLTTGRAPLPPDDETSQRVLQDRATLPDSFACLLRVRRLLRKLRSERLGEFFRGVSVAPPQPAIRPTRFIFTLFINCLLARNLALGALYLPKSYFGTPVIFDDRVLKFIVGQDPKNPFMICLCAAPTFV
jgi:hypothetical protein